MINRTDIHDVLTQMRTIRAEIQQVPRHTDSSMIPSQGLRINSGVEAPNENFGTFLKSAVDQVNHQQGLANDLREAYERGEPGIDLPQVMIQAQKSSVSFDALVQVRRRFVEAYDTISRMQI